jgi:GDP-L-fucose synthase
MENNKKILVTGSNGLLGTSLKEKLGEGHVYHTRKDADLTNYDETFNYIKNKIENDGVDTIIHCAAKVGGIKANMDSNEEFFKTNYYINNNVLKVAAEFKIENFVNVLSTCIFPSDNIEFPLTPEQIDKGKPHETNYGYSYAKRLSGYETKIFRNVLNKNWFSVIPTNLYGRHDNFNLETSHLIAGMIHRAYLSKINNEKFVIWGDGKQLRQFVHSDDLADLILWSLENWKSEEHCMLINETEISVLEIANLIKKKFEFNDDDIVFDISKPKGQHRKPAISHVNDYNFKPIEEGINETIDWFIKNYNTIKK